MADKVKSFRAAEPADDPERRSHYRVPALVSLRLRAPCPSANEVPDPRAVDPIAAFEDLSSTASRYRKELSGSGRVFLDRLMVTMDALVGELTSRREEGSWTKRTLVEASLSAGGIGFVSARSLDSSVEVEVEFSVLSQGSSVPFRIVAEVRRCERLADGSYNLGLQFLEMTHSTRERLVRLVFDLQRVDLRQRASRA